MASARIHTVLSIQYTNQTMINVATTPPYSSLSFLTNNAIYREQSLGLEMMGTSVGKSPYEKSVAPTSMVNIIVHILQFVTVLLCSFKVFQDVKSGHLDIYFNPWMNSSACATPLWIQFLKRWGDHNNKKRERKSVCL